MSSCETKVSCGTDRSLSRINTNLKKVDELLATVRPQAVPLVDGFAIPDYLLNSALGRYDGNAYPALVDFATREPINGQLCMSSFLCSSIPVAALIDFRFHSQRQG